ncbi:hypothetical protein PoB_006455600 [Plakobranchus ocellatus]|uniref:Flagellar FliJ protein n=1 Tax=Plakobranchus ocellatus TaxID=259542 RepID=A0AAV4D1J2_9GAST|nr:hypothetical protein PoB_006455600 [Plakobranchus ocellatus]
MSKETNLRYEQPHKPSKLYQEYTKQLEANDRMLINNLDQKSLDDKELHDKWFEKSNLKVKAKAIQIEKKQLSEELKLVAKASMLVRKKALALKMEEEQKMYDEELREMGKTFHKQRI